MPQQVSKRNGAYVVYGPSGVKGRHASKKEAMAQKFAIDVSEGPIPGVKPRKSRKKKGKKRALPFVKGKR